MRNGDKALLGISLAGHGQMLITLEPYGIFFFQILHTYTFKHCLDDETWLSINLSSHGQLVKSS